MSYIKAYSDENLRHQDLYKLKCPGDPSEQPTKVEFILAKMAEHFGMKPLRVTWNGRGGAFYEGFKRRINFTREKTTWLTVCHEFAHALTDVTRGRAADALLAQIERAKKKVEQARASGDRAVFDAAELQVELLRAKREKLLRLKAHSADFDENVDKVCAFVRERNLHEGAELMAGLPALEVAPVGDKVAQYGRRGEPLGAPAFDLKKAVFDRLPATLRCRKCWHEKPKEEIGVRVMSRSADGRPTKVDRQSYCKDCRSEK